ncbi:MAG: hypothetical protein IKS41_05705, partial [Alphaproteobacteria bacterium]|nr:hypothetical protein [Alphaproteobacteria bacterium]
MRKIIGLLVMFSMSVSSMLWSTSALAAPLTMSQIYGYARHGDLSSLKRIKSRIDTIGRGGNTALCQAVYNQDYGTYYNLKAMGASRTHPCINRISQAQIYSFNQGYHDWAIAVNRGAIPAPAGMSVASGTAVATETGLSTAAVVGIGVAAAVVVGGGI